MRLAPDGIVRRTMHYTPADQWAMVENATVYAKYPAMADSVILELEDGVHPDHKQDARDNMERAMKTLKFGDKEVLVRINHLDTEWGREDLATAAKYDAVKGIILPKVDTLEYVREAISQAPDKDIWLLYETPDADENMSSILRELKKSGEIKHIKGILFGNNDYSMHYNCDADDRKHPMMLQARSNVLRLAAQYNLLAIDGPSRILGKDEETRAAYRNDSRESYAHGFHGRQTVSLQQIAIANDAFTPTKEDLVEAGKLHNRYQTSKKKDDTEVIDHEGRLTENLHDRRALDLLKYKRAVNHHDRLRRQGLDKGDHER